MQLASKVEKEYARSASDALFAANLSHLQIQLKYITGVDVFWHGKSLQEEAATLRGNVERRAAVRQSAPALESLVFELCVCNLDLNCVSCNLDAFFCSWRAFGGT